MSTQPEALRLAQYCDGNLLYQPAAAELRRLHEVNTELLEALKVLCSLGEADSSTDWNVAFNEGAKAIAKATRGAA